MKKHILIALTLLLPIHLLYAQDAEVLVTDEANNPSRYAVKLNFIAVEDDVKTLTAIITIPLASDEKAISATGKGVIFKDTWQKSPGKVIVGLGNMNTLVDIETNRGPKKYKMQLKLGKFIFKETGCKDLGITAQAQEIKKLPIYVGIKCEKVGAKELLHISVPGEIEWDSTAIFEIAGKGERWKMFDLIQVGATSNGTTQFAFQYKNKPYTISLQREKDKGQTQTVIVKPELFNLHLGLGVAQLAYTTPLAANSATAPLIFGDLSSVAPYLWKLVGQASLIFAMPLTGQQFYSFVLGTGPQIKFGSSQLNILGEYTALGQDESKTSTSFTHSQMGLGLKYIFKTGLKSTTSLHGSYSGLGGVSTHIGFRLHYEQQGEKSTWGGMLSYNMQTAKSQLSGNNSDFNQILLIGTYKF